MHGSAGAGGAPHVSPTQLDPGGGGVEVEEHVLRYHPADAAPLVRDLDSDVVRALDNVNLDEELLMIQFLTKKNPPQSQVCGQHPHGTPW